MGERAIPRVALSWTVMFSWTVMLSWTILARYQREVVAWLSGQLYARSF
jgi:hypothetical protein